MTTQFAQSSIDPDLLYRCLADDFAFALASMDVPTTDPEVMKLVFAILVAMGGVRLLELAVPREEVECLASETLTEIQRIKDPNPRSP